MEQITLKSELNKTILILLSSKEKLLTIPILKFLHKTYKYTCFKSDIKKILIETSKNLNNLKIVEFYFKSESRNIDFYILLLIRIFELELEDWQDYVENSLFKEKVIEIVRERGIYIDLDKIENFKEGCEIENIKRKKDWVLEYKEDEVYIRNFFINDYNSSNSINSNSCGSNINNLNNTNNNTNTNNTNSINIIIPENLHSKNTRNKNNLYELNLNKSIKLNSIPTYKKLLSYFQFERFPNHFLIVFTNLNQILPNLSIFKQKNKNNIYANINNEIRAKLNANNNITTNINSNIDTNLNEYVEFKHCNCHLISNMFKLKKNIYNLYILSSYKEENILCSFLKNNLLSINQLERVRNIKNIDNRKDLKEGLIKYFERKEIAIEVLEENNCGSICENINIENENIDLRKYFLKSTIKQDLIQVLNLINSLILDKIIENKLLGIDYIESIINLKIKKYESEIKLKINEILTIIKRIENDDYSKVIKSRIKDFNLENTSNISNISNLNSNNISNLKSNSNNISNLNSNNINIDNLIKTKKIGLQTIFFYFLTSKNIKILKQTSKIFQSTTKNYTTTSQKINFVNTYFNSLTNMNTSLDLDSINIEYLKELNNYVSKYENMTSEESQNNLYNILDEINKDKLFRRDNFIEIIKLSMCYIENIFIERFYDVEGMLSLGIKYKLLNFMIRNTKILEKNELNSLLSIDSDFDNSIYNSIDNNLDINSSSNNNNLDNNLDINSNINNLNRNINSNINSSNNINLDINTNNNVINFIMNKNDEHLIESLKLLYETKDFSLKFNIIYFLKLIIEKRVKININNIIKLEKEMFENDEVLFFVVYVIIKCCENINIRSNSSCYRNNNTNKNLIDFLDLLKYKVLNNNFTKRRYYQLAKDCDFLDIINSKYYNNFNVCDSLFMFKEECEVSMMGLNL